MAKYPNRISVPTAITKRTTLDLSCQHITTGNFMDFMLSKRMRLVPTQSVEISHNLFSRADALIKPTYGDSTIRSRAFFVPYRTIMPAWNDFIEDTVHNYSDGVSSLVPFAHRIKNSQLVLLFQQTTGTESAPAMSVETDNLDTADIVIILSNGTPKGYNLTPHGSRTLKLLLQCGIGIDFNLRNTDIYHSAMQLLSLAKVYYDWYYQNQYINDEFAMLMESFFNYDQQQDFADWFTAGKIAVIFAVINKVNYDSDYYVSAWDNPVAPTSGSYSAVEITDPTVSRSRVQINDAISPNGTPLLRNVGATEGTASTNYISQYSIDALKSLNDYCKRKQIAGARVFDRYLAEFGVTLESEALKRSIYITDYVQEVSIGDVTSTSDTEGASLGSYAGKAISAGQNGVFNFETPEEGELIIISTIIPRVSYYQGQDKTTMAQTRMDFWLPEFDAMGVQSLDTREVFMPLDARQQYPAGTTSFTALNYNNLVFGFVPRYAEYKRGVDMITGDFRLRSREAGGDSWSLFRDLTPIFSKLGIAGTKHDRAFTTGYDSEQYSRIFNVVNEEYDHFKIQHNFKIITSFPGHGLYDDYEFKDEDKAKHVKLDVQGVKVN